MDKLLDRARDVMENAYAPYSSFKVGACLLDVQGGYHSGCNVENASYGLTICAERCAACSAIAAGQRKFKAIGIVCDSDQPPVPCGACLQFLSEFTGPDFVFILGCRDKETIRRLKMCELMPTPFVLHGEDGRKEMRS